MNEGLRRVILYKNDLETPADLRTGERVQLIRGDGPREGEKMGVATVMFNEHGLLLDVDGTS